MGFYGLKIVITALLVVAVSEMAKRSTIAAAILASIPLISVLAISWIYLDTKNVELVAHLAKDIFWLVLPSLVLFLSLPWLLMKLKMNFYGALTISIGLTVACYLVMLYCLKQFGKH